MRWRTSVFWLCALTAFAACGEESTSSGTDATTTSTVDSIEPSGPDESTVSATDPPSPSTSPADEVPPTTARPTTTTTPPPTTAEAVAAACTSDAILPVVAAVFPDNESWNIIEVDVLECQNGYARVIAIPDQSLCDPEFPICLENEQVFLVDVGGSWRYLDSGTGIECDDPSGLSPGLNAACEALGLT